MVMFMLACLRFGNLEKVNVVLDGHSGRSRGFAFIYFENIEDATEVSVLPTFIQ